jgi:hypothetical protein
MLDAVEHAAEGLVAGVAGQHGGQHVGLLVVRDGLAHKIIPHKKLIPPHPHS